MWSRQITFSLPIIKIRLKCKDYWVNYSLQTNFQVSSRALLILKRKLLKNTCFITWPLPKFIVNTDWDSKVVRSGLVRMFLLEKSWSILKLSVYLSPCLPSRITFQLLQCVLSNLFWRFTGTRSTLIPSSLTISTANTSSFSPFDWVSSSSFSTLCSSPSVSWTGSFPTSLANLKWEWSGKVTSPGLAWLQAKLKRHSTWTPACRTLPVLLTLFICHARISTGPGTQMLAEANLVYTEYDNSI